MLQFRSILNALVAATLCTAGVVQAAYTVNITQVGTDVIANGQGSLDLTGLTQGSVTWFALVCGTGPALNAGELLVGTSGQFDVYYDNSAVSGPVTFGPGACFNADGASGDRVGLFAGDLGNSTYKQINVPQGYVFGTQLTSTATWTNQTIAGLGLTPGTYTWTWAADSFTLIIAGGSAGLMVTPTSIDFGSVPIGAVSGAQSITISNPTATPIAVTSIGVPGGGLFNQVPGNCPAAQPFNLAAGASCTLFDLSFSPSTTGPVSYSSNLTINGQNYAFDFSGNGIVGITVSPLTMDFGTVAIGSTSATQSITIANPTSFPVAVTTIGVPGGGLFSAVPGNCPATQPFSLSPGATCTLFDLSFSPSSAGPVSYSSNLIINGQPYGFGFSGAGFASTTAPAISSSALPNGTVGSSYSFTVTASGSPEPTFHDPSGTLPPGLTIAAATGAITGTPTQAGTFHVTLVASNGVLPDASADYDVTIAPAAVAGTTTPVPTMSQWGLLLLGLLLAGVSSFRPLTKQ